MRNLIVLSACCFVIATAGAKDPPASPATPAATKPSAVAPAPVPSKAVPVAPAKPAARPLTAAEQRIIDERAELDLQARIAARIAEMRANQKQRAAAVAVARARKTAQTKKKQEPVVAKPAAPANGTHWAYDGEFGPSNWSKINAKWNQCGNGGRQSPIDIRDGMKVDLEKLSFDYKPSSFSVIDTGHTIQVNLAGGNFLTVQNRSYELLQFHFHRPSEERINGKSFEMVVHLVHRDAEGKLAVLAVLLERGAAHNMIQTVWNNLPLEKHDTVQPSVVLDVAELLPERRDYYTYMGSLTTPPCTEGVLWLVMKQPMQASPQQMAIFSRLYPFNARPVQQNAGRVIKESN